MSKNFLTFLTVIVLACFVLIWGCKQKQEAAPAEEAESKGKTAIVISTLNNPWFVILGETAAERARQLGYEATIFDSQNDTAKETNHFENIIAAGYKAILFNPTDADGKDGSEVGGSISARRKELSPKSACCGRGSYSGEYQQIYCLRKTMTCEYFLDFLWHTAEVGFGERFILSVHAKG